MTENKRYIDGGEDYTEKRYKLVNPNNMFKDMNIGIVKDNTYILKLVDVVNLLNEQEERIKNLKETIIKITIAYQRKHDNTIVNLVNEVWEEDISDLTKNGDVE